MVDTQGLAAYCSMLLRLLIEDGRARVDSGHLEKKEVAPQSVSFGGDTDQTAEVLERALSGCTRIL